MPARSHPVPTSLWGRRFRVLSPGAKLVHLYVLTCPHRRSEGLFELAPAHVAVDTGLEVDRVVQALDELHEAGALAYDHDAELVLDETALRVSPLRNGTSKDGDIRPDKRIDPAIRHFELLPDSPLKARFVEVADEASPDLANEIRMKLGDTYLPDPWKPPYEGPSQGASTGASTGASEAPSRDVSSTSSEDAAQGEVCHWCGEPALVQAGVVQVGPGDLPWCTFCNAEGAA